MLAHRAQKALSLEGRGLGEGEIVERSARRTLAVTRWAGVEAHLTSPPGPLSLQERGK
jgi:hypothetical protein